MNRRGIAVILVLGTLVLLSGLAVDFGFNTDVQYRLALAERDRLQAEYLARSASNFMRLILAKERALKAVIVQLSGGSISPVVPLCKQFPFSTELLRSVFAMAGAAAESVGADGTKGKTTAAGKAATDKGAKPAPESGRMVTIFEQQVAKDFLPVEGDFSADCEDETGKFNLNIFATLNPLEPVFGGMNRYDRFKLTLADFLNSEAILKLLDEDEDAAREAAAKIARNLADWVDPDETINEPGGAQGGAETGEYREQEEGFKLRNGAMLSLDEAYFVAKVDPAWFPQLAPHLTVWGGDKVNICTADDATITALVAGYAAANQRIPKLTADNRDAVLQQIAKRVATDCTGQQPSVAGIASAVESILMNPGAAAPSGTTTAETLPTGTTGATAGGGFADLITINARIFKIVATGRVPSGQDREVTATMELVLDTKDNDPKKWAVLYWRWK